MPNEKLEEKMIAYVEAFGDSFPTIPLAWSRSDEELIDIIDECLEQSKDVYELGYVTLDPDIIY